VSSLALGRRFRGSDDECSVMTRSGRKYVIAPPHPDDLARVKAWFEGLSEHVRAVDYVGARPLFADDMIAFGTFENFITGRERVEKAQWRNVWGVTSGFHYRTDDIRAIVSADRLTAIGMGVFDSIGYNADGSAYQRPGRTTVALSRRAVGRDWVADHTHMSLFRDVPSVSFGAGSARS
jgi:ketosteroid isomerase-like protein